MARGQTGRLGRTSSQKAFNHLADIVERLKPSSRHDTMDRTLVLFTFAIALGMRATRQPKSGSAVPGLAAEPIIALDREALTTEFEP
jgi:hypothetical protein